MSYSENVNILLTSIFKLPNIASIWKKYTPKILIDDYYW